MTNQQQLRMRVFAGPNGSGKSTVIEKIRKYKVANNAIDFGYYINADDIAQILRQHPFPFSRFDFTTTKDEFVAIALKSGLIGNNFSEPVFLSSFSIADNLITLTDPNAVEKLAQILADFLRNKMLELKRKFSFETVFSHQSKVDIMHQATAAGYKVYLYFVSTEAPEINIFRVKARVEKGGHYVDPGKIESRYNRSLDLLYEACQVAYQTFFFDNSVEGQDSLMFAHFKKVNDEKQWDEFDPENLPEWFFKYYYKKIN